MSSFVFEGRPISFRGGESVLIALLREGLQPAQGGCLCLAGDCPYCLATIDGVSYTRTCRAEAMPGMIVERHPAGAYPRFGDTQEDAREFSCRHQHCDVAIIGMGESGREAAEFARRAGKRVVTLDAQRGQNVIGIYPGPLVVAHTPEGMLHVHPSDEIVVATGAAEIQPVCEGNQLAGIVTRRAADMLRAAGVDLGRTCEVGRDLVRFEGSQRLEAVVVGDRRIECNTAIVNLGLQPRNALYRMASGMRVRVVGDAARETDVPPSPKSGTVCPCCDVTVADLESVWDRGFHELELVKRATLAGTGPCQGALCVPHIRSFLKARGETLQDPFTARPVSYQLTIGEAAAGAHLELTARTALDGEHRALGANMERSSGWWRPWTYTNPMQEYWAVRKAVSIGDVSTLGKMEVSGPGAVELLERLYPVSVTTLASGRCRYVLMLDERGYVKDDGMICRLSDSRFLLTFSSSGASHAEMWVRDWAETWNLDVRLMNQTMALGAINVTGPLASELMARAGLDRPMRFLDYRSATIAGVPCGIFRLSFTGEISYELHHPAGDSVKLWRALLELGAPLGVKPHGLETLLKLRLEKGHIIVGQDTDFDSTPRRIGHEWAVKLDKPDFVGRDAIVRTSKIPLDRVLAGFTVDGDSPPEGAVIWVRGEYAGYVTSSTWSPVLNKSVLLGWLRLQQGIAADEVTISGRPARRVPTPFYDPEGLRARS